jgi:acetyl esterase/lipase
MHKYLSVVIIIEAIKHTDINMSCCSAVTAADVLQPQPPGDVSLKTKYRVMVGLAPPLKIVDVKAERANMEKTMASLPSMIIGARPPLASESEDTIAGVPVTRYVPRNATKGLTLAYFHGGGWVIGSRLTHAHGCRQLAHELGVEVVSVEYRLAPEHVYPAAIDDCYAVTKALASKPETRVAVAGDSAGGNLAAAVALRCVADGLPLTAQVGCLLK